ncbi:MAG: SxtJ family membrane protein [Thermoflexibacteraceae bacterium]|jgi:hypothetical protein
MQKIQQPIDKLKAQFVMVVGFLVLSFIFKQYQSYLVILATVLGLVFLILPSLGDLILKLWFKIAEILGWINSRILLGIVFYVFLFPLAVLSRLSQKNPLQLKKTPDSLFATRNHRYEPKDLENIW